MSELGDQLMELLALGLGLPEDHFQQDFDREVMSLTKIIHYPETPWGEFGVNAHHDTRLKSKWPTTAGNRFRL